MNVLHAVASIYHPCPLLPSPRLGSLRPQITLAVVGMTCLSVLSTHDVMYATPCLHGPLSFRKSMQGATHHDSDSDANTDAMDSHGAGEISRPVHEPVCKHL